MIPLDTIAWILIPESLGYGHEDLLEPQTCRCSIGAVIVGRRLLYVNENLVKAVSSEVDSVVPDVERHSCLHISKAAKESQEHFVCSRDIILSLSLVFLLHLDSHHTHEGGKIRSE